MKTIKIVLINLILIYGTFHFQGYSVKQESQNEKVLLKIKVLDEETNQVTPVMACISRVNDGVAFVPPDGARVDSFSLTPVFYKGIEYKS